MISSRTRYSLIQFLDLQYDIFVIGLLRKYDLRTIGNCQEGRLFDFLDTNINLKDNREKLLLLVEEIARTSGDLRTRVIPHYRFDERFDDLRRCLQLDGYLIEEKSLTQIDPSINDAPPLDDDLIKVLKSSSLPEANDIIQKINDSTNAFTKLSPDYNACLNSIRVALETLARSIADNQKSASSPSYDPTKWGSIIAFLRTIGFINPEEEKGLAGVYGFVSPGSHRPLSDEQMTRLGRSLSLNMCWFLIKKHQAEKL